MNLYSGKRKSEMNGKLVVNKMELGTTVVIDFANIEPELEIFNPME